MARLDDILMPMRVSLRVLAALSISFGIGYAQTTPDVAEILKTISVAYNVERYEFEVESPHAECFS